MNFLFVESGTSRRMEIAVELLRELTEGTNVQILTRHSTVNEEVVCWAHLIISLQEADTNYLLKFFPASRRRVVPLTSFMGWTPGKEFKIPSSKDTAEDRRAIRTIQSATKNLAKSFELLSIPKRFPRFKPQHYSGNILINVRGSNGSGKSHIIFTLLDLYRKIGKVKKLTDEAGHVWAYKLISSQKSFYVLGRYESPTGGCDTIKTLDLVLEPLEKLLERGDVIFEGLVLSGLSGRLMKFVKDHSEHHAIFGVLDTPLKKCMKRVWKRRAARGETTWFNPRHVIAKQLAVFSSKRTLLENGMDVRTIPHNEAWETVLSWIPPK